MAKLLKNTYSGYEGNILLDTYNLATPEGASLSRLVSYSNETVSLLSDTVRNNILLYRDVSDDRLETAVRLADLRVPMNRKAGDGARFLSSGERRKLELARALIDNPQVMILDEVVSILDIETAYEIEKLVLSLEDRTVIMISNAFSGQLLDRYDQIVLMSQGSILAQGTHSELMQKSDEYREIYRLRCGSI
jgi:ABC-type multidrug transport system fused ATPase/permease subunit